MAKRLFDLIAASCAIVVLSPVLVIAALAILIGDGRPVLYRARRTGIDGTEFTLFKFRSMRNAQGTARSVVTSTDDPRIFTAGQMLRKSKVDELPQLFNILRGDMSIVGPRPEDPAIVDKHFSTTYWETLFVRPGLASPGSIYNYTHGEKLLVHEKAEDTYVKKLLPTKMALDRVYVRNQSFIYDLRLIARTLQTIAVVSAGRVNFDEPPEMPAARRLLDDGSEKAAA